MKALNSTRFMNLVLILSLLIPSGNLRSEQPMDDQTEMATQEKKPAFWKTRKFIAGMLTAAAAALVGGAAAWSEYQERREKAGYYERYTEMEPRQDLQNRLHAAGFHASILQEGANAKTQRTDKVPGEYLVIRLIEEDRPDLLKEVLQMKPNLNVRSVQNNDTPLMRAARNGKEKVVDTLIAHGADVNAVSNGKTAAYFARQGGHTSIYNKLTTNKPSVTGVTPLMTAVEEYDIATVRSLIAQGAKPEEKDKSGKSANSRAYEITDKKKRDMMLNALRGK